MDPSCKPSDDSPQGRENEPDQRRDDPGSDRGDRLLFHHDVAAVDAEAELLPTGEPEQDPEEAS